MSRVIKFRSANYKLKDDTFSHFSYWGKICNKGLHSDTCFTSPSSSNFSNRKYEEQFTGLNDRKGKEIFEGDICAYSRYSNWQKHNQDGSDSRMIGEVRFGLDGEFSNGGDFHAGTFYLRLIDSSKYSSSSGYSAENIRLNQTCNSWGLEIIGNIHENPEVLK